MERMMLRYTPYSDDWLHDMTRAAASGHVDAAWEMADYYANAPARPRPSDSDQSTSSFKLPFQLWRAFDNVPPRADSRKNINHYASLLQSPQERMQMAMYWLRVGTSYGYLPALVSLAKIHICKYILPVNTLNIFGTKHPDEHNKDDHQIKRTEYDIDYTNMEDGIENPYYSPRLAHDCLAMLLALISQFENASVENPEDNRPYAQRLGIMGGFPEVAADIEDRIPSLREDAYTIADRCGIDVQNFQGGVYRTHEGKRGNGIFEFGNVEVPVVWELRGELMPGSKELIEGSWEELKNDSRVEETPGGK